MKNPISTIINTSMSRESWLRVVKVTFFFITVLSFFIINEFHLYQPREKKCLFTNFYFMSVKLNRRAVVSMTMERSSTIQHLRKVHKLIQELPWTICPRALEPSTQYLYSLDFYWFLRESFALKNQKQLKCFKCNEIGHHSAMIIKCI